MASTSEAIGNLGGLVINLALAGLVINAAKDLTNLVTSNKSSGGILD